MARALSKAFQARNILPQRAHLASIAPHIVESPIQPYHWDLSKMTMSIPEPMLRKRTRYSLPASLMRAGTSRGLFIQQKHLPANREDWKPWILAAMGSKNNDVRQIDGVGGATSTTSKVAVISPSNLPGIDVEYTFIQVAIGKESLDFSGNCGNMASGVGPFAVEEGLVMAKPGATHVDVSILNTNTGKRIVETVEVDSDGQYCDEGDYVCPGVKTPGSEVKVAFMNPEGSMTGRLFPTGQRTDIVRVGAPRNGIAPFEVQASFVDAANPFIIVNAASLPGGLDMESDLYLDLVEDIRREGAVQMGLARDTELAALTRGTPKLAFVSSARPSASEKQRCDVNVSAMSMGRPHPSLQLTGAVCLGAATCIPGTVLYAAREATQGVSGLLTPEDSDNSESEESEPKRALETVSSIWLQHPSGQIKVDVKLQHSLTDEVKIESCSVSRTARKIFDGQVMVNL